MQTVLPVDVGLTESHQTIILFIHVQILHKTLAKKVIKTPKHT